MSETIFQEELQKLGIVVSTEQLSILRKYLTFLLEYNKHTNLTSIRDEEGVWLKHFYDSILLNKYFELDSKEVLDIGTGAGFPGIPLKIINPHIKLTLLESNGKKVKFLNELKEYLNIEFTVIKDRAENYIKSKREKYDLVVSRAVAALPMLSELCIPFVKVDGYFIAYKGQLDDTLENGNFAISELGGQVERVESVKLPIENSLRTFVIIKKVVKTPDKYPRLFDKINKKPLQK